MFKFRTLFKIVYVIEIWIVILRFSHELILFVILHCKNWAKSLVIMHSIKVMVCSIIVTEGDQLFYSPCRTGFTTFWFMILNKKPW